MVFDLGPGFLIGAWGIDGWADVRSNTEEKRQVIESTPF